MRNIIFKRLLLCQKENIRSIIDRSKRCSVKFCEERVWKNFNESVTQFVIHQRTICAGLSKKAFDVVFQSIPSKRSKQHPRRICDRLRSIELEPSKHRPINIKYSEPETQHLEMVGINRISPFHSSSLLITDGSRIETKIPVRILKLLLTSKQRYAAFRFPRKFYQDWNEKKF